MEKTSHSSTAAATNMNAPQLVCDTEPCSPILGTPTRSQSKTSTEGDHKLSENSSSNQRLVIAYNNLSHKLVLPPLSKREYDTFASPFLHLGRAITGKTTEKQDFYRIQSVSGVIAPGTMTLVIAPPGHGKSSFLKALAHQLPATGDLRYNGASAEDNPANKATFQRVARYVDQVDAHLDLLTVSETLDLAQRMSAPEGQADPARAAAVTTMLGLDECKDTIVGSESRRGISGGQKRRVSLGEAVASANTRALLLDEFTNGLDAATSEDIARSLRRWCSSAGGSVVAALQQPTPGLMATFDELVLLRDGREVYHGPADEASVLAYLQALGYACPGDVAVGDFLVDVLSQPEKVLAQQRARLGGEEPDAACVSVDEMEDFYRASPYWRRQREALALCGIADPGRAASAETPASATTPAWPALRPVELPAVSPVSAAGPSAWSLLRLLTRRQGTLLHRDHTIVLARAINVLAMSLIYGLQYMALDAEDVSARMALFMMALAQFSFNSMLTLPQFFVAEKAVVLRHLAAGYHRAWQSVLASVVAAIPLFTLELACFSVILYFLVDNYVGAEQFFVFFALSWTNALCMTAWFGMLGAASPSETVAMTIAGPSVGCFMMFAGVFTTEASIPPFLRYITFWLFPYSWLFRGMAINEMDSPRYDAPTSSGQQRIGDAYLASMGVRAGSYWIGLGVLYVAVFTALIMGLNAILLARAARTQELARGTRRFDAVEATSDAVTVLPGAADESKPILVTLREAVPFHPAWLSFSDVKYTVQVQVDGQTKDKVLLDGVSGYAEPGKLTALMGASGAGKTTLLDVLAGRKTTGTIEGTILLNGRAATPAVIAASTGYVEQFDSLFAYDTVRETLLFAARLRLPASVPDATVQRVVDEILDVLDLAPIAGSLIGNAVVRGLSPSQLKRVSIGVELCANPSVIFLDEPTTGLDSRSAQTVMNVIRRVAQSGRAVVCTIHQPSAEIFYFFDRLALLAPGGHEIYFGDLGPRSACLVKYLQAVPGVAPLPARHNPASWMLEVLGVGVTAQPDEEDPRKTPRELAQRLKKHLRGSCVYESTRARLLALEGQTGSEDLPPCDLKCPEAGPVAALPTAASTLAEKQHAPLSRQLQLLQRRNFTSYWRNPLSSLGRLVALVALSVMMGLTFLQLSVDSQDKLVPGISSKIFPMVFGALLCGAASLPLFLSNRRVLYTERAAQLYSPFLWTASSLITELVYLAPAALLLQVPLYFLIGLRNDEHFFSYLLVTYILCVIFVAMSALLAAASPTPSQSSIAQGFYFSLFFSVAGVAMTVEAVPRGFLWLYRALPLSHAVEACVMTQTQGDTTLVFVQQGADLVPVTVEAFVSAYLGFGYDGYWASVGWLVLYLAVVVILALAATQRFVFTKR